MAFWDGQLLQTLSFCPAPGFSKHVFWGEGGFVSKHCIFVTPPDFQKLQFWPIPTLSFEALPPPPPPPGRTAWAGAGGPGPGRRPGRSSGPPPGTPWAGAGEGPRACAEAQEERGARPRSPPGSLGPSLLAPPGPQPRPWAPPRPSPGRARGEGQAFRPGGEGGRGSKTKVGAAQKCNF